MHGLMDRLCTGIKVANIQLHFSCHLQNLGVALRELGHEPPVANSRKWHIQAAARKLQYVLYNNFKLKKYTGL